MRRAGVADVVHGRVGGGGGADAQPSWIDDPCSLSLGDCVCDDDGGCDDNLSMEVDDLLAILDSEQPDSSIIHEDVFQGNQSEGASEALLALPLEVEECEHSQFAPSYNLDVSNFKEGNVVMPSYETSEYLNSFDMYNQSFDNVKTFDPILIGNSSDMNRASNCLGLSTSGYNNFLMDPVGRPIVPLTSESFQYQRQPTEIPEALTTEIPICKAIQNSQNAEHAHNIHLGYGEVQESVQGDNDSLLEVAVESCEHTAFILSSDSFYFMSMNDVRTNAMLKTERQEENTCPTGADSSNCMGSNSTNRVNLELNDGLSSNSPNMLNVELRNGQATELTWDTSYNLPVIMNSSTGAYIELSTEKTSRPLCGQASQLYISNDTQSVINVKGKEADGKHVHSGMHTGNGLKPCLQQETFHDSSFDASSVDSDSSFSERSCNGTYHVEGVNLQCASNADSLQVCFNKSFINGNPRHLSDSSERSLPDPQPFIQSKKQKVCFVSTEKDQLLTLSGKQCHFAKAIGQALVNDLPGHGTNVDEDPDICIIHDTNNFNHPPRPAVPKMSHVVPPRCRFSDPYHPRGGSSRFQADNETLTFQIALQDLAQPKSEAYPPEGVLAVPLLRHQRIALSWMVQKETLNLHCSGGILADDQGLGKTVSTIALILMERSPLSKSCNAPAKSEFEALNLDEDDEFANSNGLKLGNSSMQITSGSLKSVNAPVPQKGRPAAGTLVVCPTSVLRQWADELKNKVTRKADLSFLVYHGSNRTRDPYELVKYDVVLTTYSIVSMEVPMRSTVDKSDVGKGRPDVTGASVESSVGKKRKDSGRNLKDMNTLDGPLLESTVRPLARVGWFRVILDEAQTIKNHRTQVARACWGLRAKRRWCLSGTPIQNAVDDLYSYFRFLRYDPFAVYHSFCSKIKLPINRDPAVGYRKLQAVLKTIMLRRTKGTLLDGKPIINLPPKTIMLKKVGFSYEERVFYSKLEAESREKFKGYADAGTVKQNYVNILLMLLRLRQACDHPLLVKGCDSSSVWRSSLETAKKVPRDKQMELLNCLEMSLALCTICNDPPEDAVVAICGHVFCSQCICEHLTGEDSHCPSASCKVKLTGASIFSKATLKSCLSGVRQHDCPEPVEMTELLGDNISSDSSKIKAAVEILQSLPTYDGFSLRSSYCIADDESADSVKTACSTDPGVCTSDNDKACLKPFKCSNPPVSEKAIVYSQWTRMLDLLEARLKSSSIQYRRLDGTMSVVARDKAVKDFNTLPEVTVMIMSLKAASLGLNMVSACHVLLLDLWWNPTTEDQAIDRAHRIGQTRPVTVSRLTVENTVEDRILALQEKKREMVASAFGEDESGSRQTRLTVEDLRYLFSV